MMTAWSLAWLAVFVAIFFEQRAIRLHVAAMTAGLGIAIVVAGLPGTLIEFVIMSVTLWTAAIALGSISERLRSAGRGRPPHRAAQPQRLHEGGDARAGAGGAHRQPVRGRAARPRRLQARQRRARPRRRRPAAARAGARRGSTRCAPATCSPASAATSSSRSSRRPRPRTRRVAIERMRAAHEGAWSAGVTAWRQGETLDVSPRARRQAPLRGEGGPARGRRPAGRLNGAAKAGAASVCGHVLHRPGLGATLGPPT